MMRCHAAEQQLTGIMGNPLPVYFFITTSPPSFRPVLDLPKIAASVASGLALRLGVGVGVGIVSVAYRLTATRRDDEAAVDREARRTATAAVAVRVTADITPRWNCWSPDCECKIKIERGVMRTRSWTKFRARRSGGKRWRN